MVAGPTSPLAPLRSTRWGLATLVVLFVVLVGCHLHGFSISVWQQWIDGSPPEGALIGRARPIRIDDYAVILPLAFAQERHVPPFPVVNTFVGRGQNMLLPFSLPVWHPVALFRPDAWGFFLGADTGMAWRWWSRTLGLFAVAWLLLRVVTAGQRGLSAFGALFLVGSPFFQFWALRPAPVAIHTGLLALAALGIAFARRPPWIALGGVVLGYAAVGFLLALYPPFQVPLAYVVVLVFAALAWAHRDACDLRSHGGWRVAALLLATLIAAAGVALFLGGAGDAVERMRHTAYPGRRISLGGGRSPADLLAANVGLPLLVSDYGPLVNACEAAGFFLLSPALLVAAVWGWAVRGRRPDGVALALAGAWIALILHATTAMPAWLARASLWSFVPGHRSVIALGMVEVLLVARLLSREPPARGRLRAGVAVAWGGAVLGAGLLLARELPELRVAGVLGFAAGSGLVAWIALGAARRWVGMAALAAASVAVSAWFNPLMRNGSEALLDNELARAVLEVDREHGGATAWVAFARMGVGNLFRAAGVDSVDGVHPVPQLELWKAIDPDAEDVESYNRYAHVVFRAGPSMEPAFLRTNFDLFRVVVHPASPALRALGVTHVVVDSRRTREMAERGGAEWLRSVGRYHLLREPWARRAEGDGGRGPAPARPPSGEAGPP
jgi:hypothetical protein